MKLFSKWQQVSLSCLLLFSACGELAADVRIWRATSGHVIEGEWLDMQADGVRIRRAVDGRILIIALELLSAEDRRYVQARQELETPPQPSAEEAIATEEKPTEVAGSVQQSIVALPKKYKLRGVPMVRQQGSFCVPASAAMIAQFHGLKADQELIATLSSAGSIGNEGTKPSDMAHAMQKLGFETEMKYWELQKNEMEAFQADVLPFILNALVQDGPLYVSYAPGVFGTSGHGCVIIGYDAGKEYFYLHNPWGVAFKEDYKDFLWKARGVVRIKPLKAFPAASESFIKVVQEHITDAPSSMAHLSEALAEAGFNVRLTYCNRRDERRKRRFAENTARREGRLMLDLAFARSSAVIIPKCDAEGRIRDLLIVTKPVSGSRLDCRFFSSGKWQPLQPLNLGELAKNWAARFPPENFLSDEQWDLPMIELIEAHPVSGDS